MWACQKCTLENLSTHLGCTVCGAERPHDATIQYPVPVKAMKRKRVDDDDDDDGKISDIHTSSSYSSWSLSSKSLPPYLLPLLTPHILESSPTFTPIPTPTQPFRSNIIPLLSTELKETHTSELLFSSSSSSSTTSNFSFHLSSSLLYLNQSDGWSCGYVNAQMLLSAILPSPNSPSALSLALLLPTSQPGATTAPPSIRTLQALLQKTWSAGFDKQGSKFYSNSILNSKTWTGCVEFVHLFNFLGLRGRVVDFKIADTLANRMLEGNVIEAVFRFVWEYFTNPTNGMPPPLFLQYVGHSVTIVGIEMRPQRSNFNNTTSRAVSNCSSSNSPPPFTRNSCPHGPLSSLTLTRANAICDVCEVFTRNAAAYKSCKSCDYDVCQACHETPGPTSVSRIPTSVLTAQGYEMEDDKLKPSSFALGRNLLILDPSGRGGTIKRTGSPDLTRIRYCYQDVKKLFFKGGKNQDKHSIQILSVLNGFRRDQNEYELGKDCSNETKGLP